MPKEKAVAEDRGSPLNSAFYMLMSIMALNFLGLASFVSVSLAMGLCTKDDLYNTAQVLVGNNRFVMSKDQISEYQKLKEEKVQTEAQLTETQGNRATREATANAAMDMSRELEERVRALQILRSQHENQLIELRDQIESTKKQAQQEYEKLQTAKKSATVREISQNTDKVRKILLAMDPVQIANYFMRILPSSGPAEIARMISTYLPPDVVSEVFAGMPDDAIRRILPVIENRYADIDSATVVRSWTTPGTEDFKNEDQMAEYLKHMSIPQAFAIFNQLDPKTRSSLVQLLRAN